MAKEGHPNLQCTLPYPNNKMKAHAHHVGIVSPTPHQLKWLHIYQTTTLHPTIRHLCLAMAVRILCQWVPHFCNNLWHPSHHIWISYVFLRTNNKHSTPRQRAWPLVCDNGHCKTNSNAQHALLGDFSFHLLQFPWLQLWVQWPPRIQSKIVELETRFSLSRYIGFSQHTTKFTMKPIKWDYWYPF